MNNKIYNFCGYVLNILCILSILYLLIAAMSLTCATYNGQFMAYLDDSSVKNIVFIGTFIAVICGFKYLIIDKFNRSFKIDVKYVKYIILAFSFIFSLFALCTQYVPVDDPSVVLNAVSSLWHENYKVWHYLEYCFYYSYQTQIIFIYYFMSHIIGTNNYVLLQVINVFFLAGSYYFIYKLSGKFIKNNTAQVISLIALCVYLPYTLFLSFIYGTIIGYFFGMAALYLQMKYLEDRKLVNAVLAGVCIAIAFIAKPNYVIFLIAMVILYIFNAIKNKNLKNIGVAIYTVVIYFVLLFVLNAFITSTIKQEIPEGVPFSEVVFMAISEGGMTPGWENSQVYLDYAFNDYDSAKTKEFAEGLVKLKVIEYANDPKKANEFFGRKIMSQWINPTFECFQIYEGRFSQVGVTNFVHDFLLSGTKLNNFIFIILDLLQTLILFGALIYLILNFKSLSIDNNILMIVFIGGFIFHIIAEARCYYTIPYFVLLIPYCVAGINQISDCILNVFRNKAYFKIKTIAIFFCVCVIMLPVMIICSKVSHKFNKNEDEYYRALTNNSYSPINEGFKSITPIVNTTVELANDKEIENHLGEIKLVDSSNEMSNRFYFSKSNSTFGNNVYMIWNGNGNNYISAYNIESDNELPYLGIALRRMEKSNALEWHVEEAGDGAYYMYYYDCDRHYLEYNVDANGKCRAIINKFTGSENQKWIIK